MHVFSRTPLTGSVVERNLPPPVKDRSLGTLQGVCGNLPCELSTAQLTGRNAFMLGGPRSGKSNAIKLILSKLLPSLSPDDFAVVFDPRGDYLDEFYSPKRGDLVISTLPRHRHITQGWNIFSEIRSSDPYNREMFTKDIVCRLVREDDPKQKFFVDGARNIFCGVIDNAMRLSGNTPDNRQFRDTLCSPVFFGKKRHEWLDFKNNPKYAYLEDYFSNPNWNAGSDFRAFAKNAAENHFISNAFGGTGHFSICDFVRKRGGRVLYIEYDTSASEALGTLVGLLIDLAMNTMMANDRARGRGYFVLDELPLIECSEIEKACNFMGGHRGSIIAAAQSHSGMYKRFGEYKADSIIASFASLLFFQCRDAVSRDYIKNLCGKAEVRALSSAGYTVSTRNETQYIVDDEALNRLRIGEAIVRMPDGNAHTPPFIVRLDEYKHKRG